MSFEGLECDRLEMEMRPIDDIYVPGEWHCQKCRFHLHNRVIRAMDGAVGINKDAKPEMCPNECGMLEKLTWKQEAEAVIALNKKYFEVLKAYRLLDKVLA